MFDGCIKHFNLSSLSLFFFFLLSVVMTSRFALFSVECFIRLHLLETIVIEPDGLLVELSR